MQYGIYTTPLLRYILGTGAVWNIHHAIAQCRCITKHNIYTTPLLVYMYIYMYIYYIIYAHKLFIGGYTCTYMYIVQAHIYTMYIHTCKMRYTLYTVTCTYANVYIHVVHYRTAHTCSVYTCTMYMYTHAGIVYNYTCTCLHIILYTSLSWDIHVHIIRMTLN